MPDPHPGHQASDKNPSPAPPTAMTNSTHLQPGRILRSLRGVCLLSPWLVQLFGTNILLSVLLPVSFIAPTIVYHVSSKLAFWVWEGIQKIFTVWNGARITTSGTRLPQNESAIVISNHVTWADFYLVQELALQANMLPYCRWFAKQQLRWVPFLGWGLWAMGMPLVSRNWDKDQAELQRVFKGPRVYKWPMCMSDYKISSTTNSVCRAHQLLRSNQIHASEVPRDRPMVQGQRQSNPQIHFVSPDQGICGISQSTGYIQQHQGHLRLNHSLCARGSLYRSTNYDGDFIRAESCRELAFPCSR